MGESMSLNVWEAKWLLHALSFKMIALIGLEVVLLQVETLLNACYWREDMLDTWFLLVDIDIIKKM